jgi:hypothetical protein
VLEFFRAIGDLLAVLLDSLRGLFDRLGGLSIGSF